MMKQVVTCPDCRSEMRLIKIIDSAGASSQDQQLGYTAEESKRGWFSGSYSEDGKVAARMCPSCGRIVLYGELK